MAPDPILGKCARLEGLPRRFEDRMSADRKEGTVEFPERAAVRPLGELELLLRKVKLSLEHVPQGVLRSAGLDGSRFAQRVFMAAGRDVDGGDFPMRGVDIRPDG